MIPLRLLIRRDGTMCLTDADSRPGPIVDADGKVLRDGREFPGRRWFEYEWVHDNSGVAKLDGDTFTLELANARATYKIVARPKDLKDRFEAELESSEVFDAPPIDEEVAAKIAEQVAARRAAEVAGDSQAASASEGRGGSVRIDEEPQS